jgi:hypothetical protein
MTAASNGQWGEMLGSGQRTGAGTGGVAPDWGSDSVPETCRSLERPSKISELGAKDSNWPLWQDLHNGHYEKFAVSTSARSTAVLSPMTAGLSGSLRLYEGSHCKA